MFVLSQADTDGGVVLTLEVENLDRANAPEFRDLADRAISESNGMVEVNCSNLEFIDSSGVGALIHAYRMLPAERRPIRLTGVGPKVLTILELLQVQRIFAIEGRN